MLQNAFNERWLSNIGTHRRRLVAVEGEGEAGADSVDDGDLDLPDATKRASFKVSRERRFGQFNDAHLSLWSAENSAPPHIRN